MFKALRNRLATVLTLGLALGVGANAGTLTLNGGSPGTLSFQFVTPANISSITGTAILDYSNPGLVGSFVVSDNSAPFPNALMVGVNGAVTESINLTFDFANLIVSGNDIFIPVTGAPNTPLTDPSLIALLNPSTFAFTLAGEGQMIDETNALLTYNFVIGSTTGDEPPVQGIPEPSTWLLTATAGAAVVAFRRRQAS